MKKILLSLSALLLSGTLSFSDDIPKLESVENKQHNSMAELTKELSNPVANLMQFPLEYNTYDDMGPFDSGSKSSITFKPVIPFKLNEDWLVVSRTIATGVLSQEDMYPGYGNKHGLGDTLQQTFFSPTKTTENGYVWGVGPVVLLPTATDEALGGDKYAAGPTGVILKQSNGFTRGLLAYHLWDVAGSGNTGVDYTFVQPFFSLSNKKGGSITLTAESGYDWKTDDYEIPIILQFKQIIPVNGHLFQLGVGPKYYAKSFDNGADGWGIRGGITWLLPK